MINKMLKIDFGLTDGWQQPVKSLMAEEFLYLKNQEELTKRKERIRKERYNT